MLNIGFLRLFNMPLHSLSGLLLNCRKVLIPVHSVWSSGHYSWLGEERLNHWIRHPHNFMWLRGHFHSSVGPKHSDVFAKTNTALGWMRNSSSLLFNVSFSKPVFQLQHIGGFFFHSLAPLCQLSSAECGIQGLHYEYSRFSIWGHTLPHWSKASTSSRQSEAEAFSLSSSPSKVHIRTLLIHDSTECNHI